MAAGIATLEILQEPGAYETLEQRSAQLATGLQDAADAAGVPLVVNRVGSMLTPFFVKEKGQQVLNYTDATGCNTARYAKFFHAMLDNRVYLPPSQYEAWFVGLAHTTQAIDATIAAVVRSFELASHGGSDRQAI
jgi:glutamate-1-semialdehyde 2,1-aminomutase